MHKDDKERVVADLTARLHESDALIVADYRGLTMPQIDALRGRLLEHGARFSVVKNTLTRRAAKAAGVEALLAMLEGPSAIAFVESDGNMVDVARALADSARETRILAIRGGLMQGRTISAADVDELSKLPSFDILRAQVLGAITAPLTSLLALVSAPLQNLLGLIDARIEQLGGLDSASAAPGAEAAATGSGAESHGDEAGERPLPAEASGSAEGLSPVGTGTGEAGGAAESGQPSSEVESGEPSGEVETEGARNEAETGVADGEAETESEPNSDDQEVDDGGS
jgi:large subunit ribosomal protein L10